MHSFNTSMPHNPHSQHYFKSTPPKKSKAHLKKATPNTVLAPLSWNQQEPKEPRGHFMAINKKRAAGSARFEAKFRIVQSETMDRNRNRNRIGRVLIAKVFEKVFRFYQKVFRFVKETTKRLLKMVVF